MQIIRSWAGISRAVARFSKETLEAYQVPEPIKAAWLEHTDELRPLITPETDSDCDPNRCASASKRR